MDQPKYLISDVAIATGVTVSTLRSWFARGHIALLETDSRAGANGLAHHLSLRSALRIGAMGGLVAQYVPPHIAGQAALAWTDTGDGDRDPGELFRNPETLLCVYPDGTFNVKHAPLGKTHAHDLRWSTGTGSHASCTVLLLDDTDQKVRSALGCATQTVPRRGG